MPRARSSIDWPALIRELIDVHGYSRGEIARQSGTVQAYVTQIYLGRKAAGNVSYDLGVALIALRDGARRRAARAAKLKEPTGAEH